jgi:WD40 repeat protein
MMKALQLFCFAFIVMFPGLARAQQIEIAIQKGHSAEIQFITFNSTGRLLASSGADNLIKLWHVPTGKEMASWVSASTQPIKSMAFGAGDDFLFIQYADGAVHTWDVATSSLKSTEKPSPEINFPDQKKQASGNGEFEFKVDRFFLVKNRVKDNSRVFARVPVDISKNFTSLTISEKNSLVLGACEDGKIYVYDMNKGKSFAALALHYDAVNSICFSPDHSIFATASADRSIILWDTRTRKPIRRMFSRSFRFECLAFDAAGTHLAVGDELGKGRIIELQSSLLKVSTYPWHQQKVSAVQFSPDDTLVYSAGYDNRLVIFDIRRESVMKKEKYRNYWNGGDYILKKLKAYREPYAWITALSVSPSGRNVIAGGGWRESIARRQPQPIYFDDHQTRRMRKMPAHQGSINSLAFLSDWNFASGTANQLVSWHVDPSSGDFYLRKSTFPALADIRQLIPVSEDTLLLNATRSLIWFDLKNEKIIRTRDLSGDISAVAYGKNEHRTAYALFNDLVIGDANGEPVLTIKNAHTDKITSIAFSPTRRLLATTSWDATVKLWNTITGELLATIIPIGSDDHIIITPDNYYFGTRNSLKGIGFKFGKQFISPEQFDLRFNRPDIVLKRLGFAPANVVNSYHRAYQKRLQKMNFTEQMLGTEIHLPEIRIITEGLPLTTAEAGIRFAIEAVDSRFKLDRINVFVNNIPVFGVKGIDLRPLGLQSIQKQIEARLSAGKNKIQVSCLNEKGVESLLKTVEVEYNRSPSKPNLYLAVISVSRYADSKMNLKYAAKDGRDLASFFLRKTENYDRVFVDSLFNEKATRENILALKKKFAESAVDDEVMVFVSGHGMLDNSLDFYFGTHDVDFNDPGLRGLKYEDLETLLDGIPARKKLLMIDACHSGEVDKTRLKVTADQSVVLAKNMKGTVKSYTYEKEASEEQYQVAIKTSFELMQELFTNVSKGSGAVVISAAAGNSYALESDEWKNGIFTYCLLYGLKSKKADFNEDGVITVNELKSYVSKEVERLTDGAQKPTSRSENLEFDFKVY